MSQKFMIPVLASILILGTMGLSYDAFALDNNGGGACSPPLICDADDDGFFDIAIGGTDCNDFDATVFPGAPEVIDGIDNNCNGFVDEGVIDSNFAGNLKVGPGELVIITGATVSGNIKNDGGTIILQSGSIVDGNIKTKNGGTLTIDASTVNGNVNGKDSAISITDGSIITGNVKSDGSTSVAITDSTIQGNLNVKNAQNVSITGTTVSGNLKVNGANTVTITGSNFGGNFKVTNSNSVLVSGNAISGNLSVTSVATCNVFGNTSGSTVTTGCNTVPPNTPPTIASVTFTQDASGDASVIFGHPSRPTVCHANGVMDADGDLVTLSFEWLSADGTLITTGNTLPINSVVNEQVTCKVTPFDGTDFGASVSSSITLITPGA